MFKRTILVSAVALVAFSAGVYVGYRWLLEPQLHMQAIGESFLAEQYATMQFREAPYAEARAALAQYLEYLNAATPVSDSWKPGDSPWLDARGLRIQKTLAWSRLAVLHERHGSQAAAEEAWRQVEALAKQGKYRDPSREYFRSLILRELQPPEVR